MNPMDAGQPMPLPIASIACPAGVGHSDHIRRAPCHVQGETPLCDYPICQSVLDDSCGGVSPGPWRRGKQMAEDEGRPHAIKRHVLNVGTGCRRIGLKPCGGGRETGSQWMTPCLAGVAPGPRSNLSAPLPVMVSQEGRSAGQGERTGKTAEAVAAADWGRTSSLHIARKQTQGQTSPEDVTAGRDRHTARPQPVQGKPCSGWVRRATGCAVAGYVKHDASWQHEFGFRPHSIAVRQNDSPHPDPQVKLWDSWP